MKRGGSEKEEMKSDRRKIWKALLFAVLFVAFVSVGCVSGTTPPEEAWNPEVPLAGGGGGGGTTAPEEAWNMTFGGTGVDSAESVQQTVDGGYILVGSTYSYGAGKDDVWLVKTDSTGSEEWNRTFGGTDWDGARSVQQTVDGGYILAGYTKSYSAGYDDFWLVKTDSTGIELWNKTFGGTGYDDAYSVQQTADDGFILVGDTGSYGAGFYDAWLVKTDANGNEQWNKTFGGTDFDHAFSVQQTVDGGYILAGETYGDFWLVKTDNNGNELWNKTFGGTGFEEARSVQQTTDGGYILAGDTNSYGAGGYDFWLVKTDDNGNEQWNKTFGSGYGAKSVQRTTDGGYILVGCTAYGTDPDDFWLAKTDSNGTEQWNQSFGGTEL